MRLQQTLLTALVVGTMSTAACATDIFTPALPASPDQNLSCTIINVSGVPQFVTSQALDSKGSLVAGMLHEKLAPGEAGGFSIRGDGPALYCRFRVTGDPAGFRTSIEVFESTDGENFRIVAALPGH